MQDLQPLGCTGRLSQLWQRLGDVAVSAARSPDPQHTQWVAILLTHGVDANHLAHLHVSAVPIRGS